MVSKQHYSSPEEARQIALHTEQVLAAIRRSPNKAEAKSTANTWFKWADANHVCKPIRDHVILATSEVVAQFGERPPLIRNPAGADK